MEHKGYIIKMAEKSPALKTIVTAGQGGKIPQALSGMFTSDGVAMQAIDKYLKEKGAKSGKAKTNSSTHSSK